MIIGPFQIIACPFCEGLAKYMTLISGNTIGASIWTDGKMYAPMLPCPPEVVKCHHCGEIYWLRDAKRIGSIDPWAINPSFQRAKPGEQRVEKPQLGSDGRPVPSLWIEAQSVSEPPETDYYQAIEKGLAHTLAEEKALRIHAWWRRNDPFRESYVHESVSETRHGRRRRMRLQAERIAQNHIQIPVLSGACRNNLEALVDMLNQEDARERIMRAEALRELGQFESAKMILRKISLTLLVTIINRGIGYEDEDVLAIKLSDQTTIVNQLWTLCENMDTCVKLLEIPIELRLRLFKADPFEISIKTTFILKRN